MLTKSYLLILAASLLAASTLYASPITFKPGRRPSASEQEYVQHAHQIARDHKAIAEKWRQKQRKDISRGNAKPRTSEYPLPPIMRK